MRYRGRFAPTPSGPLHAGSLVAALASWLDARAQGGAWLVRIEDVDTPRCVPGADALILSQLAALGLHADEEPQWQSQRSPGYRSALARLVDQRAAYPCSCTRKDIELALGPSRLRHEERIYPGTCRPERGGPQGEPGRPRAMRLRVEASPGHSAHLHWTDRRLGPQSQDLPREVGDFIVRRADGLWAYQLAVVVDDAAQGITDVVRGEDLADNTPRQIWLQQALGLPTPRYLHTPLVRDAHGEKLSKRLDAPALDVVNPLHTLQQAGAVLGLDCRAADAAAWREAAVAAWADRWALAGR
jgi:glutamyl-Q tRNA(Asp) synthetase